MMTPTALLLFVLAAASGPPTLMQTHLQEVLGFSSRDIVEAERSPVVREIESGSHSRGLAVAGFVRIEAPPRQIAEKLRHDRGLIAHEAVQQSGTFSVPAVPSDTASYRLPLSDLETLEECEVGSCKVKMVESGLQEMSKLDWSAPDADERASAIIRRRMVDYVNAYLRDGRSALAVYGDKSQPMSLASGLDQILDSATYVDRYVSALDRHLEEFPSVATPGAVDLFHWSVQDYGYRPVTDISHTVIYEPTDPGADDPAVVIARKHLFASHYFQARVELIGLFAAEGGDEPLATYVVYVDRSLFDDEIGGFKRRLLVRGLLKDVKGRMEALQKSFAPP